MSYICCPHASAVSVEAKYKVETVGGSIHRELWVPAEKLPAFNQSIVGKIDVVAAFRQGFKTGMWLTRQLT